MKTIHSSIVAILIVLALLVARPQIADAADSQALTMVRSGFECRFWHGLLLAKPGTATVQGLPVVEFALSDSSGNLVAREYVFPPEMPMLEYVKTESLIPREVNQDYKNVHCSLWNAPALGGIPLGAAPCDETVTITDIGQVATLRQIAIFRNRVMLALDVDEFDFGNRYAVSNGNGVKLEVRVDDKDTQTVMPIGGYEPKMMVLSFADLVAAPHSIGWRIRQGEPAQPWYPSGLVCF
jgi:hypothetical protein